MRNLINHYYKLEPIEIHQKKGFYTFDIGNSKYRLIEKKYSEIEQAYKLVLEFYAKGLYINYPIKTNFNTWQIEYNHKSYNLVQYDKHMDEKITLENILDFQKNISRYNFNNVIKTNNWGKLWSEKLDYFEYQMNQFGIKYSIISETFAYYIGLAELGIALFNNYYDETYPSIVEHKRIEKNSDLYELYNPFNMIKDLKVRDISEYFKNKYLYDEPFEEIKKYLKTEVLSKYEKIMFFIRMLYPSFYFDMFEEIIDEKITEKEIKKIIKKTENYDSLIKKIYEYLSGEIEMPFIIWFK